LLKNSNSGVRGLYGATQEPIISLPKGCPVGALQRVRPDTPPMRIYLARTPMGVGTLPSCYFLGTILDLARRRAPNLAATTAGGWVLLHPKPYTCRGGRGLVRPHGPHSSNSPTSVQHASSTEIRRLRAIFPSIFYVLYLDLFTLSICTS